MLKDSFCFPAKPTAEIPVNEEIRPITGTPSKFIPYFLSNTLHITKQNTTQHKDF